MYRDKEFTVYTGCRSKIWNNFLKRLFSLIYPVFEKKSKESKFSWLAIIFFYLNSAQNEWTRKETAKNLWFA